MWWCHGDGWNRRKRRLVLDMAESGVVEGWAPVVEAHGFWPTNLMAPG